MLLELSSPAAVDVNTNSIIVIADKSVQQVYKELIDALDQHRPQVMIEAKVVVLDTSDNFTLGIEVSGGDRTGTRKLFQFTSYGLSTVEPTTGALSLIPGRGFNWTLVVRNRPMQFSKRYPPIRKPRSCRLLECWKTIMPRALYQVSRKSLLPV